jgi:hypothetical protein
MPTATGLLNDLSDTLVVENRDLHFRMLLQRLIELFREDRLEEALCFGADYLSPLVEERPAEFAPLLEQVMALVLFPEKSFPDQASIPEPLRRLYAPEQRQLTAQFVNQAILENIYHRPVGIPTTCAINAVDP